MVTNGINGFRGKRVLLLQGPVGPFFYRLSLDLEQAGATVFKVNFNGGDWLFYRRSGTFNYRGTPEDWPDYLESLLKQLNIEVIMLFGDCRPIHTVAHEIAHKYGLEVGVFEEGYVRPNYITYERFGVNGHSLIPRTPIFYLNSPIPKVSEPIQMGNTFWPAAIWANVYYFFGGLLKPFFLHYKHHRPLNWFEEYFWARSLWRKYYYAIKEHGAMKKLLGEYDNKYYLVPLQVYFDAQIHTHSDFGSVEEFINRVMVSFSKHASRNSVLVLKHHPIDRGYVDYNRYISKRTKELGLKGRCFYIHDQHLPTLLDHAQGVIVVNSTVGLSALLHNAAVKVCGNALYDMKGLTYQGSLNQFWRNANNAKPKRDILERFVSYLVRNTQINGSFYKRTRSIGTATGLIWPDAKPNKLEQKNRKRSAGNK